MFLIFSKEKKLNIKKTVPFRELFFGIKAMTGRVSRVLSRTVIYLRRTLPHALPAFAGCRRAHKLSLRSGKPSARGVASDRVYRAPPVTRRSVSSYLAFPSLPYVEYGGLFLLHFPGSHLRRTLSVILPYEARTFLAIIPFGNISRDRSARS